MQIDIVGVTDIDRVWPKVIADVVRCLRKAPMEIGPGDIWANCRSGQWLLIIAHDGKEIVGTTVWRFTANHYFECVILTGKSLKDWLPPLIDIATTLAKAHDCRGLVATGRPGLSREINRLNPLTKVARVTFALEL